MTDHSAHVAVYGRMTRLYPRSFRHDYGSDLITLFARQIEDEPPLRVWLRTLRDLAVSVPVQRLEPHMKRPSTRLVAAVSGVVAGTAALLALTLGTGPAMPVFLVVALAAGATALWSWQASQPVRPDNVTAKSWWKVLVAGPALAALTLGAMAIPWPEAVDLGDNAYWLIVIAFMASLTLAAAGLLLGMAALIERRRTRLMGTSAA
jgi:hypothetical protein